MGIFGFIAAKKRKSFYMRDEQCQASYGERLDWCEKRAICICAHVCITDASEKARPEQQCFADPI
jgi:hypothetical protein